MGWDLISKLSCSFDSHLVKLAFFYVSLSLSLSLSRLHFHLHVSANSLSSNLSTGSIWSEYIEKLSSKMSGLCTLSIISTGVYPVKPPKVIYQLKGLIPPIPYIAYDSIYNPHTIVVHSVYLEGSYSVKI